MYSATTSSITVNVTPEYLGDQSEPDDNHFVWSYTIQIENHGKDTVQLISRYWQITDHFGRSQEVHGPGVVGEQPVLLPGEAFEYTSGTALPTPSGIMLGRYQMTNQKGDLFEIDVPAFSLDCPYQASVLN